MASSNRHWPSMFKSKPCNSSQHQWQHDINSSLVSTGCHRNPYNLVSGGEERTPDPKPRWNPKPEQIRILEAIFNSGMVNPPRDEIRKIRAQLQEYGQVGDANVFYWFQNRKSRSKHKQRHLLNTKNQQKNPATAPSNCSSSSSDKSSLNSTGKPFSAVSSTSTNVMDVSNSPTASVNQTFFQTHTDFLAEPFFFPVQQPPGGNTVFTQGFSFPDVSGVPDLIIDHTVGDCSSILLSDLMLMNHAPSKKPDDEKTKMQEHLSYSVPTAPTTSHAIFPPSFSVPSPPHPSQGIGESGVRGPTISTVYINDVCFEVSAMVPFNVRDAFGDDAVLVHSSGQPVLTNEWGVTLQPLHHGAFYYLMRTFTPSPVDRTMDLI
ncbi:WUSCHEL-related homeobox 9-like [Olea europaea subsp. europaea]|uniref:Protein WUSCHEL n=1 Tax=Olea europaea subsp. europaea TaxID=158383 RepID=A0A8S0U3G8_OLEEU|nr:WUSCHEL-related homeobox 9-like [Olea europaea subsp. europaea]